LHHDRTTAIEVGCIRRDGHGPEEGVGRRRDPQVAFFRADEQVSAIDAVRLRFTALETPETLGERRQSTARRSAFGAPRFQLHMTLLNPGSDVDSDLTLLGRAFRSEFQNLRFDRLEIRLHEALSLMDDD
jgi:hypothetical protein